MLAASLERISIGLLLIRKYNIFFVREASSPCNGNHFSSVIGLVSVYVRSCHQKKIVIERTRDLIYLKFVATDFFLKIISPSAGENSGDLA